ncbi:hypothetical protein LIER_35457 [Lithospermum erythrorhizon]|uniref:Retrotransposon gag domain-containing protein n=1 Tax=Lithospermum erythrorhizon TaxID=34254 RepID=A0AAV3NVN6_LITER
MEALERDMILITQGGLSVDKYERRFSELCRLLPAVYPTEEQKINRFRVGLTWEIRHQVSLLTFTSMHELRNPVLKVEMELAEPEAWGMKRVRQETFTTGGSSSSRFQRRTFQTPQGYSDINNHSTILHLGT